MVSSTSPRLNLPLIQPSQAQKHVTHNEALMYLDGITQLVVTAFDQSTPPEAPIPGDIYALTDAPTGVWAPYPEHLAMASDNGWITFLPQEGWQAWDLTGGRCMVLGAEGWQPLLDDLQNLSSLGVNASADSTNRLTVSSDASLFNHAGAGHQMKLNKATAGDTASLLIQSNWSGRAEIGLSGDDNLHVKVSADGGTWTEALVIDGGNGLIGGAAVQVDAYDQTAGRLMRADYGYGPGSVVGSVSMSDGLPSGAVIEQGENANGSYVRFADGTQICRAEIATTEPVSTASGALFSSSAMLWTYPAPFAANMTPTVTGSCDQGCWISRESASSNDVTLIGWSASETSTYTINIMAVGRWA